MRVRFAAAALAIATTACATGKRGISPLPPLGSQSEVYVYALPLPREADRLSFTLDGLSLRRQDGTELPLQLEQREVVGAESRGQRLLAWGRVPPGEFEGLVARARAATLARDGQRAHLLVEPEPSRIDLGFRVAPGSAVVVWLALKPTSMRGDYAFSPAFSAALAPQTPPQLALYCTNAASSSVTAVDLRARRVTGVLPVGGEPRGIALDRDRSRAYVALSREDQIQVLDVAANAAVGRIRLSPGDGPGDLALAPDGTLVVANVRSRTVSFVDPVAMAEVARVPVGDAPSALLIDRSGRRAYVANGGTGTVSALDVANHAVVGTLATDPEPVRMQLSRDGSRLYVAQRGSAYLAVFALPSLALQSHAYVGLGAITIKVDPRTDLIYLARGGELRISVYEPVSLQLLDEFDVPGPVSYMAIDGAEDTLLALMPDRRAIAVVDLTSRKLLAEIPVGAEPYAFALPGERF